MKNTTVHYRKFSWFRRERPGTTRYELTLLAIRGEIRHRKDKGKGKTSPTYYCVEDYDCRGAK